MADPPVTGLVEFLKARLDDDEKAARAAGDETTNWYLNADDNLFEEPGSPIAIGPWGGIDPEGEHIARHGPARVLAEVAAKRRIVFLAERLPRLTADFDLFDNNRDAWAEVLKRLALPYASHPEYDESWRP